MENEIKKDFVHLHCHSDYSLYDGFQKIENIVKRVSELKMKGIAITDHGKVGSFIKFYKIAKKFGIKPIFGLEAYICNDPNWKNKAKRYHLTILAKNKIGYRNLLKIASISHRHIAKVWRNEIPRINFDILKQYSDGLIILSGCIASEFSSLIVDKDQIFEAENLAKKYKEVWGGDYYIEVSYTKYKPQLKQIKYAEKIAKKLGIKIVATNDCHYTYREEAEYQISKIALSRGRPFYPDGFSSEYYIKNYDEMNKIFNYERESYLQNTMEVFEKCNVEITLGRAQLPFFEVPKDNIDFNKWKKKTWRKDDEECFLQYLSEIGLKNLGLWNESRYKKRLYSELETIKFTGFVRYFLIVWEYCHWAKENDVRIGKGRGSGAGSLVLYCLGVIGVDPIKRELSMDRFLYAEAEYRADSKEFFKSIE